MEPQDCQLLRSADPVGLIRITTHRKGRVDAAAVDACMRLMRFADWGLVESVRTTGSARSRSEDAACEFRVTDLGRLVLDPA